jgi:acetyltransferase-like isoleucine patch superfamily enzyme
MLKAILLLLFRLLIAVVYAAYKAEGLNALLLFLPAKLIPGLLRQHGAQIGRDAEIHSPLLIHNASPEPGRHYANLRIGDECYLGRDVFLDLKAPIQIEDQVTVSMRVSLITHTHVGRSPLAERMPPSHAPILLRQGAYLGAGATVLQGVEVGYQAVVAAGALVRKNVPGLATVAGVPARVLSCPGDHD